jgi:glycosyltransferase involved in cell wall biosynthesis
MTKEIRIVQLIDSLDAGGAERMAINYANTLADVLPFSGLVTTRKEGALKAQLSDKVGYLFLNKQGKLGLQAVLNFRTFITKNKIDIIHAHSSSFFTAVLVKLMYPKVKIVWHDHYGDRMNNTGAINTVLKAVSFLFYGVLTVNKELEQWAKINLAVKKIHYFPNFIIALPTTIIEITFLKGTLGKRMVFLANLKKPKNHLQILKAYVNSDATALGWSLHLIGKNYADAYAVELGEFIEKNNLQHSIFIYNSCNDIEFILKQANIGLLGSTYEGFPVTLLEYGKARLAVVSTNVGYCSAIIQDSKNGLLFGPTNLLEITKQLNKVISNESKRIEYATALNKQVIEQYSDKAVIMQYLDWLEKGA